MADQTAATPVPEEKPATDQPEPKTKSTALPIRKHHRFVRWIRKRHRLLTFLGAMIVFSTFIVKDALREQLRDLVDSIDKAESFYVVRNDLTELRKALSVLRDAIQEIPGSPMMPDFPQPKHLGSRVDEVGRMFVFVTESFQLQWVTVDNARDLLEKLPWQVRQQEAQAMETLLTDEQKFVQAEEDKLDKLTETEEQTEEIYTKHGKFKKKVLVQSDPQFLPGLQRLLKEEQEMEGKLAAFCDRVLKEAHDTKTADEHRYKIATWASYFLYALGWSLGLMGRLVGVETGAGE